MVSGEKDSSKKIVQKNKKNYLLNSPFLCDLVLTKYCQNAIKILIDIPLKHLNGLYEGVPWFHSDHREWNLLQKKSVDFFTTGKPIWLDFSSVKLFSVCLAMHLNGNCLNRHYDGVVLGIQDHLYVENEGNDKGGDYGQQPQQPSKSFLAIVHL